jgi:hypothetical protein
MTNEQTATAGQLPEPDTGGGLPDRCLAGELADPDAAGRLPGPDAAGRLPDRDAVVAMLAGYGDRTPGEVDEELGSLELTWLVAAAERRYSVLLDLSDETFADMTTVTGAVAALRAAIAEQRRV